MAFVAIAGTIPQYEDFPNWWMQAYEQGTTTKKVMANDSVPTTTFARLELDSQGFPNTTGNTRLIPFIDGSYDLWLFPTEQEAIDDDTSNAIQLADNIENADPSFQNSVAFQELTTVTMTANTERDYEAGDVVEAAEFSTGNGGGGTYNVVLTSSVTPNGRDIIQGVADTTISFIKRPRNDSVSLPELGILNSGDITTGFEQVCAYAAANNIPNVIIPYSAVTLTQADASGVKVIGINTVVTGEAVNTSEMEGIIINTYRQDDLASHPQIPNDDSPKLINQATANFYRVFCQKKSKGYILCDLKNNVTTPADSLAVSSSDITSWRVTSVANTVDVRIGFLAETASTGTWSDVNLITDIDDGWMNGDGGVEYQYKQASGSVDYSMTIDVPTDGKATVGILLSNSSTTDATILVDGVAVLSNISFMQATAAIRTYEFTANPGSRVIKVQNNLGTGLINLLGCNFARLKEANPLRSYDSFGYYRIPATYSDYITSTSANDYAIRDKDADTFGGSFHGGEGAISTTFLCDGDSVTLSVGEMKVCDSLSIPQTFTIDFTALGGALLNCETEHEFLLGGYSFSSSFTGAIRAESFFTTLYGINEDFDNVKFPKQATVTSVADGERIFYGNDSGYRVLNSGDQAVTLRHTTYNNVESEKGGAYTWRVVGEYHKYYYSPVDRGDRDYNNVASTLIATFN